MISVTYLFCFCEMRYDNFGETATEEVHNFFFSGKGDKYEHGAGYFDHKDIE